MAPMTRSNAAQGSQSDGLLKPSQELYEGSWQMVALPSRPDRELSEEPASSFGESDLMSGDFDDDEDEGPLQYTGPEDHEDILHPLREAANRVGREVERFAEVLDGYNPQRATAESEKHEMTIDLIDHYHNIALDTLDRLREQHSAERRRKDGARWRKKMRRFNTMQDDDMDIEEPEERYSPNSEVQTTLEDLERWEQEAQTWDLLGRLVKLRFQPPGNNHSAALSHGKVLHQYSSEREVWNSFLDSDNLALERRTVLRWLQDTAEESGEDIDVLVQELQQNADRGDIIAHGWLHTKAAIKNQKRINVWPQPLGQSSPDGQQVHLNSSKTEALVTQLDPDSASRQGRKLEAQDEYFERAIWLGCYELLRRGKSASEVKEWCMERTEIWRAVSMSGLPDEASQEEEEDSTPVSSGLWRRMCFALARKGGGDAYERAVYGILSGDIPSVEPVCRSLDDFIFTHYNALLRTQFDHYLQARHQELGGSSQISSFGTFDAIQFHGDTQTAAARLIEGLKTDQRTMEENMQPMKMLQGVLIANTFENFVYQQGLALSKFANESGLSILIPPTREQPEKQEVNKYIALDDHDSLRVLAHVLLVFVNLGADFGGIIRYSVIENIIVSYISFLRLAGKEELIPLYCSQLSGNRRYATLCRNLIDVTDPEQRYTQTRLMRELGLDVQHFVKMQSRYLVQDYPDNSIEYPAANKISLLEDVPMHVDDSGRRIKKDFFGEDAEGIERVDLLLIRSLEWYLLVEGLWSETFLFGTMLYKRFFKHMHLPAARVLASRVPSSMIASSKTPAILGTSQDFIALESETEEDLTEVLDGSADQKKLLKKHLLAEARSFRELEALIELLDNMETTSSMAQLINEEVTPKWQTAWRQQLGKAVQDTREAIGPILHGWLITSQRGLPHLRRLYREMLTAIDDDEFALLREAYLPETILAYISILKFAGYALTRQFLLECMELSTLIAAEDSDLLEPFEKSGRVQELVEAFASASKLLLTSTSGKKSASKSGTKKLKAKGWENQIWNIKL
ncbi:hypothetical protein BP5796_07990 [Coleophoma crateriformis]|uniref:Nuclear pore complex protein n=1 Tax=Coleophoma crateriformis TaxID=565419 RepID=A0A3D8RDD6_9HELO|nr:hypothetical protein BP5796_07990 [Coleophoma crateriformis]